MGKEIWWIERGTCQSQIWWIASWNYRHRRQLSVIYASDSGETLMMESGFEKLEALEFIAKVDKTKLRFSKDDVMKQDEDWSATVFGVIIVSCLDVGLTTLSKAAMSNGMNHFVFVAYSNSLATILLFPFAFIFNRESSPPLSFSIISKFFLLSLIGITVMQNCVFTGVEYSSPTLGTAMSNLIPAFTFLLSVIFRMEKLDMRSLGSVVKILGTAISILGALIVTLYRGSPIGPFGVEPPTSDGVQDGGDGGSRDWIIGGLFLMVAGIAFSVWNISQAVILKGYPSEITIVFFYCLFGSIQSTIVALVFVRDLSAWKLKHHIELTAIVYSAIFGSMVTFYVQTWCIHKKGPVFVSMFTPLGIAIAVVMGVVFLGDKLYVGSILGAVVIVLGFYAVISTQSTDEKRSDEAPLIEEKAEDHVC